jgi:uncharacterized protein
MLSRTYRASPFIHRGITFAAALLLLSAPAAADYATGLKAFNQQDFRVAFSEWIESAKAGDAHAQHGVGLLYELGQGVPYEDPKTAADWYGKAAAQNYAPAINNLARLYADGRGVKQDAAKAIELWSKAAEAGNVTARFNLGLQYESGVGVAKDPKKASEYILQAAEGGLAEAQFTIATRYRDGIGVAKDVQAARLWFDRAATGGYEPARQQLAALDKSAPVVSPAPAVENAGAAPTEPPVKPADTKSAESAETKPAETKPESTTPDVASTIPSGESAAPTQPAAETAPSTGTTAETPPAASSPEAAAGQSADSGQTPAADEPTAEAEQPAEGAEQEAAQPPAAGEGAAAPDTAAPSDNLPLAESLIGDARVFRIWLYESAQENDAKSFWEKLNAQYPALLNALQLDLRAYARGLELGTTYRVFAGPFESLGAAQDACANLKARFGDQFCRPVIN